MQNLEYSSSSESSFDGNSPSNGAPTTHSSDTRRGHDLAAIKRWLEAKQRKETGPGEDTISIVSSGDEIPAPEDPDDPTYTAPKKARSRVLVPQAERGSGTKRRTKDSASDGNAPGPGTVNAVPGNVNDDPSGWPTLAEANPRTQPAIAPKKKLRRRVKSTAVVHSDSENDNMDVDPSSQTVGPPPSGTKKIARRDAPFAMVVPAEQVPHDIDVATTSPVLAPTGNDNQGDTAADTTFIDDEAVESDASRNEPEVEEESGDEDLDKYDSEDSFIDDSGVTSERQVKRVGGRTHASSRAVTASASGPSFSPPKAKKTSSTKAVTIVDAERAPLPDERATPRRKRSSPQATLPVEPPTKRRKDKSRSALEKGKAKEDNAPSTPPSQLSPGSADDFEGIGDLSAEELMDLWRAVKASRKERTDRDRNRDRTTAAATADTQARESESTPPGPLAPAAEISSPSPGYMFAQPPAPVQTATTPVTPADDCNAYASFVPDSNTARCCTSLPAVCEVTDSSLHDPALAPVYANLPHLHRGTLVPWTDTSGRGQLVFSAWETWMPHMSTVVALAAVNFVGVGAIRNPARVSPLAIAMRSNLSSPDRYNFFCATNPAVPLVNVLCGWLEKSQLTAASTTSVRQRFVTVIFHTQEWERTTGFFATASGYRTLHAQLARDALQISSRAQSSTSVNSSPSPGTKKRQAPMGLFRKTTASGSSRAVSDSFSLPNDVNVPTYDARGMTSIDFNHILPRLAQNVLPPFTEGEIPQGSFVMVGYTTTIYKAANGNWTLGCNIQWVIVIGTPVVEEP